MFNGISISPQNVLGAPAWTPGVLSPAWWHRDDDPARVINTTPDPDTYRSTPNRGSIGGLRDQAVEAAQPELSSLNGLPTAIGLGGSSGESWPSDQAASNFRFLHDGSGMSAMLVFRLASLAGTRWLLATHSGSATVGMGVYSTAGSLFTNISNGTTQVVLQFIAGLVVDTTYILRLHYSTAASPQFSMQLDEGTPVTASEAATPAAGDPGGALTMLNRTPAISNLGISGSVSEAVMLSRVYTSAEEAVMYDYLGRWR